MSNTLNTSRMLSNESENETNQFEGMSILEIFMQEINCPFGKCVLQKV